MPSWTAKTKQHAVNNETHFKIARILSSPKKKEEEYSIRFNTHCPYSKLLFQLISLRILELPSNMKSFSMSKSHVAKLTREKIVAMADTKYINLRL